MLDINYIKQIDEVLDMPEWIFYPERDGGLNYIPDSEENSVYAIYIKDGAITGGIAHYELYLNKVIEAINKKNFNEGSYSFSYQILTEIDNYHVYDKYKEKTLERFYFGKRHDYDTKKEQAIIYIMDHIKEKV